MLAQRVRLGHARRVDLATVLLAGRQRGDLVRLGVAVVVGPDGKLPREVRILRAGVNETENGPYLFDDQAAHDVIEHFKAHGVRIMIDLEHLSLDEECANYDPDPRAWCVLAVRPAEHPEQGAASDLWIVDVDWLDDGVRRLNGRLQPYLSPAFPADEERRVRFIRNIAMTAMPATHGAPALVAASSKGHAMKWTRAMLLSKLSDLLPGKTFTERAIDVMLAAANEEDAGDGGGAPAGKWATVVKTAQAASDALKAVQKVKDPDEAMALAQAAQKSVDEFEKAFAALTGGSSDDAAGEAAVAPPAPAEGDSAEAKALKAKLAAQSKELETLRVSAEKGERLAREIAARQVAADNAERRQLVGEMVRLNAEMPATAWADDRGEVPAEPWCSMPLATLRARVEKLGGQRRTPTGEVRPPVDGVHAVQTSRVNISEFEINRLRATVDREKANAPGAKFRSFEDTLEQYAGIKGQQLAGAEAGNRREQCAQLSRGVQECDVLRTARGGLVQLASVAVVPIAQMGPSSQRAMEEFRLEFNTTLVSLPIPWAEDIGLVLPGGGLRTTFPLAFYAITYREQKAENAPASTAHSKDVTVNKRLFSASATVELAKLRFGDFSVIQTWGQSAATMARDRINMRNRIISNLLTDADGFSGALSGYWGATPDQPTGIDGQPFFSATHKVNPFDPLMKLHGSATWGNYVATAYPLSAAAKNASLTTVKELMLMVPGPDGNELGSSATGMLTPTCLKEQGRLMLTVQDLVLDAMATKNSVSNVMGGGNRNEHFNSGFEQIWAPQLAGTDTTADWYCYSRETIARGLPPWVLAEDPTEEFLSWDENSDHYKNTGFIKIASKLYVGAALLYPHGIRLVKGA